MFLSLSIFRRHIFYYFVYGIVSLKINTGGRKNVIHGTFSSANTSLSNEKMSSTALLTTLKALFLMKNIIHGTFSSANTSLSNVKMSSTALLTALKARFLDEKYHSQYFFLAITHGLLMKNIDDSTFSNIKHR